MQLADWIISSTSLITEAVNVELVSCDGDDDDNTVRRLLHVTKPFMYSSMLWLTSWPQPSWSISALVGMKSFSSLISISKYLSEICPLTF